MIRLAKYLKPYLPMILLSILLLFIQANADLALPDYLSKIVNIGIQQGGVANAVPQAIRQSQMNRLTIFLSDADKTRVLGDYKLVDQNSPDFQKDVKTYPVLANEAIYVLNPLNTTEVNWLNPVMAKALLAVSGIQQMVADPTKAAAMAKAGGFDLSKLPKGMDVFTLLANLPAAQRDLISAAMDKQFATLGNSMVIQSATAVVK